MAFDGLLDDYEAHLRRRGLRSADKIAGIYVRALLVELGHPAGVATGDVERWLDSRRGRGGGPIEPATRRVWVSSLRGFGQWLVETGRLERDPFARLVVPKVPPARRRAVGDADTAMALNLAGGWLAVAVALMSYCGLRCAEVAGLTWRDVDEAGRCLYVVGKGGRTRFVPLPPELVDRLPPRRRDGDPVLGEAVSPVTVSREVAAYLRSLGIDATGHQLRHTYGTHVYAATGDLLAVQQLLGHSTPATTMLYVDVDRSRLVAAAATVHYP